MKQQPDKYFARFLSWMTLQGITPELALAQFAELKRQVPLLYALLSVNALAVAYTHLHLAPPWMTVWVPAALIGTCIVRMIIWMRPPARPVDAVGAITRLRRTIIQGSLLAAAYLSWSLALSQYGGDREQAHVAIFIAITVIGCIFCLMPLPQAALAVTCLVTVPSLYYYLSMGDAVYAAIGINISLVTLVIVRVVLNGYGAFVKLVHSKSETQRLNREVTILAHTDPLTLLPNRRLFFTELPKAMMAARESGSDFAIGVIDLDRFKSVNDSQGHLFGDMLLREVGARLSSECPQATMVARLGGDEFAFQIASNSGDATDIANAFCKLLSQPYLIGETPVSIGATCGVALMSTVGEGTSLYDAADYALYSGKSNSRGLVTLYAAEHEALIRSERVIESALQSADLCEEFDVHFQPIVDRRGCVTVIESLARWTSPFVGTVRPDIFIPIAERTGMIHRLTLTLFRKSIEAIPVFPAETKLSFNLSAHDLTNAETVLGLVAIIQKSSVPSSRIVFELTETAVMRDYEAAEEALLLLRRLGVEIALDDFGTGQSSLSYLHRLPINKVKIDRSFVEDADDPKGHDLLAAVVALCSKMKIDCIAEGVETAEQFKSLLHLGCQGFQGYYFSKPLSKTDLVCWLSQHTTDVPLADC
jgi:diguanylate cyclase (GGDEF)-like protein